MKTVEVTAGAAGNEVAIKPLFNSVKDGNGFETRVANLDHEQWAPFEGIVQIEAIRVNKYGTRDHTIKNVRDRNLDCVFGIPIGMDNYSKGIRWEGFKLKELSSFDLSVPKERRIYVILSRHSGMEGSPNQTGAPKYRIIDHNKKAETALQTYSEKKRAMSIYDNLTYEQVIELSPGFGINPSAHSQVSLMAEIMKYATEKHEEFLKVWDDPSRKGMLIFKRAQKLGMITFDPLNGGWMYEGIAMGATEPAAFSFMTKNAQLLHTLELLVKDKESNTRHALKFSPAAVSEKDESLAIIERQQKMIEELQDKLSKDVVNELKENLTGDPDKRKSLIEEAKELGIKSPHLYRDLGRLEDEITTAKLEKTPKFE